MFNIEEKITMHFDTHFHTMHIRNSKCSQSLLNFHYMYHRNEEGSRTVKISKYMRKIGRSNKYIGVCECDDVNV